MKGFNHDFYFSRKCVMKDENVRPICEIPHKAELGKAVVGGKRKCATIIQVYILFGMASTHTSLFIINDKFVTFSELRVDFNDDGH